MWWVGDLLALLGGLPNSTPEMFPSPLAGSRPEHFHWLVSGLNHPQERFFFLLLIGI